jgi:hypothetical protein
MTGKTRRLTLAGLLAAGLLCWTGCNPLAPLFLALYLWEPDVPPKFELPPDCQRLAIVCYAPLDLQIEMGQLDRDLNEAVSRKVFEKFDEDKKRREQGFQVIKASKVARWQDEHPDWRSMDSAEIGQALKADYVVYIEIDTVSFYEEGSGRQLYRGHAEVTVSVVRVADGETVFPKDTLEFEFPVGRPLPAADTPLPKFRREFINRLAEKLSWYIIPHENKEDFGRDRL